MVGIREAGRQRTTAAILAAAREQIAKHGGVGLSMRAVARDAGLVSSAVYRYFETREALLTAMIVESYGNLDAALAASQTASGRWAGGRCAPTLDAYGEPDRTGRADAWRALAHGLRGWGTAAPYEFQLLYGTPIPGYTAPPETIPAAAAVAAHFLRAGAAEALPGFDSPTLRAQMAGLSATLTNDLRGDLGDDLNTNLGGIEPSGAAAVLTELAALVGFVGLELAGHFVGTADPAGPLFEALVDRQVGTLRLSCCA